LSFVPVTWPFQPLTVTEHGGSFAAERADAPTGATVTRASRHA
jgi:hypothetical protein